MGTCKDKPRAARNSRAAAQAQAQMPAPAEPRFLLLPLPADLGALLDNYWVHRGWAQHAIYHFPTFRARLELLAGTKQDRSDYLAANVCPVFAQAIMWTAAKLAEDDGAVEIWGSACWANIVAWATRLGLETPVDAGPKAEAGTPVLTAAPAAAPAQQFPLPGPDDYYRFIRASLVCSYILLALGRGVAALRLREWCIRAHRAAFFGTDPTDAILSDGKGGWVSQRDPDDLAAWIYAEEKARAHAWLQLWDTLSAELQGVVPTMVSNGYILHGGEIRGSERASIDLEAEQTFEPGTYGSVALPCSDLLFVSLPSATEPNETWLEHDMYPNVLAWTPIPVSEAQTWLRLPVGSPARANAVSQLLGNTFYDPGFSMWTSVAMSFRVDLTRYRDFCYARGFKLNAPPIGWDPDSVKARELHDGLVVQLKDMWDTLPQEVKAADEKADVVSLVKIGSEYWSSSLAVHMFNCLVSIHGEFVMLNSPHDYLTDLMEFATRVTSGLPTNDLLDELLQWTSSSSFVIASSHAISVSKLARALLEIEGSLDADGNPIKLVKSLSSLWPVFLLRSAWVHVICILQLKKISGGVLPALANRTTPGSSLSSPSNSHGSASPTSMSAEFLETLLDDVGSCLRSIDAMSGGSQPRGVAAGTSSTGIEGGSRKRQRVGRDPWRYASIVHGVLRKLLGADFTANGRGLDLTEDEVEMLSLLKDS